MRRSRPLTALAVVTALLGLAACGQSGTSDPASSTGSSVGGFPRTIDHAMGQTTINAAPKRVAALDTSFVDAALALETEVVAFTQYPGFGDELPGYLAADAEKYAKNAKPVGELAKPKVESIAAVSPDLIVSAKVRHEDLYKQLSEFAPTVFSQTTGATWKDNIRLLGKALGKESLAEEKISAYQNRAKKIGDAIRAEEGHNPTVSLVRFVAGEQTLRLYTQNSYPGIVLTDTGLARPEGQPTSDKISTNLSQEQILSVDAEKVFVSTWSDAKGESKKIKQQFQANPLWDQVKGQKQEVDDVTWISSVSLQGAHAMLDDLAKAFGVDPARS